MTYDSLFVKVVYRFPCFVADDNIHKAGWKWRWMMSRVPCSASSTEQLSASSSAERIGNSASSSCMLWARVLMKVFIIVSRYALSKSAISGAEIVIVVSIIYLFRRFCNTVATAKVRRNGEMCKFIGAFSVFAPAFEAVYDFFRCLLRSAGAGEALADEGIATELGLAS